VKKEFPLDEVSGTSVEIALKSQLLCEEGERSGRRRGTVVGLHKRDEDSESGLPVVKRFGCRKCLVNMKSFVEIFHSSHFLVPPPTSIRFRCSILPTVLGFCAWNISRPTGRIPI